MRTTGRLVVAGALLWGALSAADPNDFRVYQLGNPSGGNALADANFAAFAKELGAALTSANGAPPGTLGHAGFNVAAELSIVDLQTQETAAGQAPTANKFYIPTEKAGFAGRGPLLLPSIHVRKGLPFSFELGLRATYIDKSQMGAGTAELRWAVNEGFAYLPDICVRAYAMRLFNSRDFDLGAGGLDLGIGKRFAIGGMITLTPYVGWNLVWVGAGSNTVDFNPGRTYESSVATPNTQLRTDTGVFRELRLADNSHNRFYGGVRFIGGIIQIGAEVSYTGLGQLDYPVSTASGAATVKLALPPVTVINLTAALDF